MAAGTDPVGAGPFFHVNPARAAKTLKILQWSHFVPAYDKWFNNTYTKEWGQKNDTEVIVDNSNLGRDITFSIVALKLLVGGPVFVGYAARRLRRPAAA